MVRSGQGNMVNDMPRELITTYSLLSRYFKLTIGHQLQYGESGYNTKKAATDICFS